MDPSKQHQPRISVHLVHLDPFPSTFVHLVHFSIFSNLVYSVHFSPFGPIQSTLVQFGLFHLPYVYFGALSVYMGQIGP